MSRRDDRYRMHELVRQYAASELGHAPDRKRAVEATYAAYMLELVQHGLGSEPGAEFRSRLDRLMRDRANVLAASS